jgi:hypothetical protein
MFVLRVAAGVPEIIYSGTAWHSSAAFYRLDFLYAHPPAEGAFSVG